MDGHHTWHQTIVSAVPLPGGQLCLYHSAKVTADQLVTVWDMYWECTIPINFLLSRGALTTAPSLAIGRKEPFNLCVCFFPKLSVNSCTQLPDSFLALWVGVGGCPAAIHCSAQPRAAAWVKIWPFTKSGKRPAAPLLHTSPRFAAGIQC